MKDRIDKLLYENAKDKVKTPKELSKIIIETINDKCFVEDKIVEIKNKKYSLLYKFATGLCACVFLTSTIVFAKEIIENIFKLSKEYYGQESLEQTIEDNYIQANESNEYIKSSQGILYKFNHVLLNDINLILSLDFVFQENLVEYQGMSINGVVITDENNNLIYKDGSIQEVIENNVATAMTYHTVEKNNNTLQESIILLSPQFPDIEKLYISFDSINLYNIVNGVAETKTIEENYNIEIPVDSKFSIRNVDYYEIITKSDEEINIEEIKLTNTGLGIILNSKEIEGFGYQFKIYDVNNNEIYCKSNLISQYENMNKYFIWLDVDENFTLINKLKLEITDINSNKHYFDIKKGVGKSYAP